MSKVGIQSQSGIIQDANKLLAKKPIAWKLLGNALSLDFAKRIRASSPQTLIILRAQPDNWSLDAGVIDYANRSMHIADSFLSAGVCDFLEPPNEPVVQNDVNAKRLNEQMVQIANVYKSHGYATGAYNFSVGNPDYPLWQYLNDGIVASDGWLFLHEYGAPSLQNDSVNLSLRHRKAFTFLSPTVQSILKVGITECFIDLGATGGAGGYRALPSHGDENWWIDNLTSQLSWWDGESAKDSYVKFATGFGYSLEEPWVGLGFDVANIDTDRERFITWMQSGEVVVTPPNPIPPGGPMTTPQDRLRRAWNSIHIPYNPDAAYPKKARELNLGKPEGEEYINVEGMSGQGFNLAFLESPANDVLAAKAYDWLTGELYVPPLPPGPPVPPRLTVIPPVQTDEGPVNTGFKVESYVPQKGEKFWGLVQVDGFKFGVGTQVTITARDSVSVRAGIPITQAWDANQHRSATVNTNGAGQRSVIMGAGDDFTPPTPPPDRIYVPVTPNDGVDGQKWPTPKGDVLLCGQVGGHTEFSITFWEMIG